MFFPPFSESISFAISGSSASLYTYEIPADSKNSLARLQSAHCGVPYIMIWFSGSDTFSYLLTMQ